MTHPWETERVLEVMRVNKSFSWLLDKKCPLELSNSVISDCLQVHIMALYCCYKLCSLQSAERSKLSVMRVGLF